MRELGRGIQEEAAHHLTANAGVNPRAGEGVKWSSDLICPKSTTILTNQHHQTPTNSSPQSKRTNPSTQALNRVPTQARTNPVSTNALRRQQADAGVP